MNHLKKLMIKTFVLFCFSTFVFAGQFNLGEQFRGWSSNYVAPANFSGWEIWTPISMNFDLDKGFNVYAQSEFGNAGYTDSLSGTPETIYLTGFSDTVIGSQISFKSFSIPSILNIGLNLPSGDQTWEAKQIAANIPTQFIDSRYRGRGFGVSAMYGLSFLAGNSEFGVAAGYQYAGTFFPNYGIVGLTSDQLKLGDAMFLAFNHVQPFSENQSQVIRLSALAFLPTQLNSTTIEQQGPNLNASYSWINPTAFSFDAGAQIFLPFQREIDGLLTTEPHNSYGPRFYLNPSYALGDLTVIGRAKYVMANGYAVTDALYNACVGGFLFGITPTYRLNLGDASALKFSVGFDYIIGQNAAVDINGNPTNVIYNNWTFGTSYEVKL